MPSTLTILRCLAVSCFSGKEAMEQLLDTPIHLSSRSDVNIVLTESFHKKAATLISGSLDPFLLSLFLAKG